MKLYKENRKKLMQSLKDGLILVVSAEEKQRNSDVNYLFRQDSDFLYLTGIDHIKYALLLDPKNSTAHLFLTDLDPQFQIWIGKQITITEAKKRYKVEQAHYLSNFNHTFSRLSKKYKRLYLFSQAEAFLKKQKIKTKLKRDAKTLRLALDELRVRKSPEEIRLLQKANDISYHGHVAAMKNIKPQRFEYEAQSHLENEFRKAGAIHNAYPSIVASGQNAAILHYHDNNMKCGKNDLLLIDAGCEYKGYASDITRTFPVSGKFSQKQKEIYQVVLDAQKQCIQMIRPGVTMFEIHEQASRWLCKGLIKTGILYDHPVDDLLKKNIHRYFFPHGIGHMLGLDVHDVGGRDPKAPQKKKAASLRTSRKLEEGMVITIEPGIYFIPGHFENKKTRKDTAKYINWKKADPYRSVGGIRIEDDIVVTKTGHKNLTRVPKEIKDIEKLMAG